MRKLSFGIVACCLLQLGLPCGTAASKQEYEFIDGKWVRIAPPAKGTAAGELSLIRQKVARGHGRRACRAAKRFLRKYPGDPACEEVTYLWGEAEIVRGRLFQAYGKFEDQFAQWPNGQYAERSLLREYEIAESFLGGTKRIVMGIIYIPAKGDGLEILARIVEHAPGSSLAEKALMRIGDHHYQHYDYEEAAEAYDRFLVLFGNTPRAPRAMLQAARATYASFHGIAFEDAPLLNARQRFRVFAERYPDRARKANVAQILQRIHVTLAEKTYRTGQFYERIGRKKPARFYYRLVVGDYSRTRWAQDAREDLRRLGHPIVDAPTDLRGAPAANKPDQGAKK